MKYPKRIKYRGRVLATIYAKCKGRDSYRVAWQVAGHRHMASFPSYSRAKKHADDLVKDLAKGSQVTALHPAQARDALAALERLQSHYQSTGRRVSLLAGISAFCEADAKLNGRILADAVEGFLSTVASVKRKDLKNAVEEFAALDESRSKAPAGQRPEIGAGYVRQKKNMLLKFANMLPNHAVCDLTKAHIDTFFKQLDKLPQQMKNALKPNSAKSRNHHRGAVKQFLNWATRNDYLPVNHRLLEADSLRPEKNGHGETEFYTAKEFRVLLESADETLRPLIAIGGLAGLRTAELLRLDWSDVWRVAGHIEVTASKAKTRQRRLVEIS